MNVKNTSIIAVKENTKKEDTPFQRFLKETESKLKKEEKHTWMIKDKDHLNQNE